MAIDIWFQLKDLKNANCLTSKPLGDIFISPGDIYLSPSGPL